MQGILTSSHVDGECMGWSWKDEWIVMIDGMVFSKIDAKVVCGMERRLENTVLEIFEGDARTSVSRGS